MRQEKKERKKESFKRRVIYDCVISHVLVIHSVKVFKRVQVG